MVKGLESVLIGSENAAKLARFYREKVGLKQTMDAEIGEEGENLFAFEAKGRSGI